MPLAYASPVLEPQGRLSILPIESPSRPRLVDLGYAAPLTRLWTPARPRYPRPRKAMARLPDARDTPDLRTRPAGLRESVGDWVIPNARRTARRMTPARRYAHEGAPAGRARAQSRTGPDLPGADGDRRGRREGRVRLIRALTAAALALGMAGCATSPDRCGAHAHASSSTPAASAQCSFRF